MIKHTELRCGNKVHISGKENPNEPLVANVGEIHYFGSTVECDFGEGEEDCDIDHEDLIPIQLSEEWLIRAGFCKKFGVPPYSSPIYGNSEFIEIDLEQTEGDNCFLKQENSEMIIDSILVYNHIKYVHQLQNLYFALTGE